jgi:hypothetical protein
MIEAQLATLQKYKHFPITCKDTEEKLNKIPSQSLGALCAVFQEAVIGVNLFFVPDLCRLRTEPVV